jgi:DNA-binding transcriptional ArsR family regulator
MSGPALRVVAASDLAPSPATLVLAPKDWSGVPDALIPVRKLDTSGPEGRARAARREARFVKGPLPLGWVAAAARAGHPQALPVLLALKHKADTVRQPWVKPPAAVLRLLGVDKDARSRAIAALERAGLIEVRRRRGRPPLVRLVPQQTGEAECEGGG